MQTIADSSPAQKPGVDVPCPTRKQGCDDSRQSGLLATCQGSHHWIMTPIEEELLKTVCQEANLTPGQAISLCNSPEWSKADRMYDWRNHIGHGVKTAWQKMLLESRLACMANAAQLARQEDWDSLLEE